MSENPKTIEEMVRKLKSLEAQKALIESDIEGLKEELSKTISEGEKIEIAGVVAEWKPGRRNIDHERAALDFGIPAEMIIKHSTVTTSTAWARITKELGVDLRPYTERGEPQFVVKIKDWGISSELGLTDN